MLRFCVLALPLFGMANYVTFNSGAGCEANGAGSITTLASCSAAAAWLGLPDTTAENDNMDGSRVPEADRPHATCGSAWRAAVHGGRGDTTLRDVRCMCM